MMDTDERENADIWTAVAIGAVVGIGTALIVRARQEDETHALLRRLRPVRNAAKAVRKGVGRSAGRAGDATEELLSAGRDILDDLRQGAAEIVRTTRDELQRAARDSLKDARRVTRKSLKR